MHVTKLWRGFHIKLLLFTPFSNQYAHHRLQTGQNFENSKHISSCLRGLPVSKLWAVSDTEYCSKRLTELPKSLLMKQPVRQPFFKRGLGSSRTIGHLTITHFQKFPVCHSFQLGTAFRKVVHLDVVEDLFGTVLIRYFAAGSVSSAGRDR
jgi:hypothetical protein